MNECNCLCLTFDIDEGIELDFELEEVQVIDHDPYEGPYNVNPTWRQIQLETQNKLMKRNVIVNEIKEERVTNPGGGFTVTIGD